jgi:bifunctional enzyme CysN/CysC
MLQNAIATKPLENDTLTPQARSEPQPQQPELLRFITCGSVDDGKSTLIGRLLYDSKLVFEDHLSALDKDSKKFGTQGEELDFALLVDGLAAEREQGITIDVAYRYFSTPRRGFIVADTPGHEQYTRNMATGASTADLAVILVDARKGILPQTRRHSYIVSLLGVRHVVVAINKMDLVDYKQETFDQFVRDYLEMAKDLGFETITPIPMSALKGDNVTTPSTHMSWYQGQTLLAHLEAADVSNSQFEEQAFRFPVQWVNRPDHTFRGYAGWVASGSIKVGDSITALPSGQTSTITRIVTYDGDLIEAVTGHAVTLTMSNEIDISRGDVLVKGALTGLVHNRINARLLWLNEAALKPKGAYWLKLGTQTLTATLGKLHYSIDIHAFTPQEANALKMNEIGLATLELDRPLTTTNYRDNHDLGGFILIDKITNNTVALGLIDFDADTQALQAPQDALSMMQRLKNGWNTWLERAGENKRRSALKALTWRLKASAITFGLVYLFTHRLWIALSVVSAEILIKLVLYYLHERAWARSEYGIIRDETSTTGNTYGEGI